MREDGRGAAAESRSRRGVIFFAGIIPGDSIVSASPVRLDLSAVVARKKQQSLSNFAREFMINFIAIIIGVTSASNDEI